jgi:hypothetical protein
VAEQAFIIEFEGVSQADANRYANELRDELLDSVPELRIQQRAADPNSQDFGSTLILILGAPAVVAVAKGVRAWLERRNIASLTVKTPKGEIIARGLTSKDAALLADRLRTRL